MCGDFCAYLCAIFIPPLGVLFAKGCTIDLLINFLLTLCFWLPGACHACYVIGKREDRYTQQQQITNVYTSPMSPV